MTASGRNRARLLPRGHQPGPSGQRCRPEPRGARPPRHRLGRDVPGVRPSQPGRPRRPRPRRRRRVRLRRPRPRLRRPRPRLRRPRPRLRRREVRPRRLRLRLAGQCQPGQCQPGLCLPGWPRAGRCPPRAFLTRNPAGSGHCPAGLFRRLRPHRRPPPRPAGPGLVDMIRLADRILFRGRISQRRLRRPGPLSR